MGIEKSKCEHRCRNTCAMLSEALQDETKKISYYETMLNDCDDPAMKHFVTEIIGVHTRLVKRITEKLSTIKSNAEVLDDIMTSYEG